MVKFNRFVLSLLASTMVFTASGAEEFGIVQQTLDNPDNEPAPAHPVPHPRQMKWQETEFLCFFHFRKCIIVIHLGPERVTRCRKPESVCANGRPGNRGNGLKPQKAAEMKGANRRSGAITTVFACGRPPRQETQNAQNSSKPATQRTQIFPAIFAEAARALDMKCEVLYFAHRTKLGWRIRQGIHM